MNEEWRPVVGYEGIYEVSNFGRVKRIAPHSVLRMESAEPNWGAGTDARLQYCDSCS